MVTALGLLSYFGVKASPVTFELIPFLLLAIGTDHLFILTDAYRVSNIMYKVAFILFKMLHACRGDGIVSYMLLSIS